MSNDSRHVDQNDNPSPLMSSAICRTEARCLDRAVSFCCKLDLGRVQVQPSNDSHAMFAQTTL